MTKDDVYVYVRDYLVVRTEKQLTQTQLALKANITQSSLSRFEQCKTNPTLHFLYNLANALDMELQLSLQPLSEFDDLIKEILRNENSR